MFDLGRNGGYMVAAYVITGAVYLLYFARLVRREKETERRKDGMAD